MANLADAAPVSGKVEPPARTVDTRTARADGDRPPPVRHARRAGGDPARLPHPERRQADPAGQHDHAGRPGCRDRDHRDRHGAGHRLAQHRPVGRIARRRHRDDLRAADDRLVARLLGLGSDVPFDWVIALGFGILMGAAIGGVQGFIIAYIGVPSFIVTLGGLLSIRGVVWYLSSGACGIRPRSDLPAPRRRRTGIASAAL